MVPDPTDPTDREAMTRERTAVGRTFRIWVHGRLSAGFANGLTGVDQRDEEGGTLLIGEYVDESHLHGVLDRLGDLGIRVRRFDVEETAPPTSTVPRDGWAGPTDPSG